MMFVRSHLDMHSFENLQAVIDYYAVWSCDDDILRDRECIGYLKKKMTSTVQ